MDFNLSPEQRQLGEMVERLFAEEASFEARKIALRSADGYSRALWSKLGELGLLALHAPEELGGLAPARVETLVTMTALGKHLALEPFAASAVVATSLIRELASPVQRESILPALVAGQRIAVLAHDEPGARWRLSHVQTTATRTPAGWQLRGHKNAVQHAPAATDLLITARTAGSGDGESGISIFVVPRDAPGLTLRTQKTIDGLISADIAIDLSVNGDALLGPEGGAYRALSNANDLALAALCAEAVGTLQRALDATVEHTKTRKQFGVPIARFQALQHRMADMLMHVEQARSMSYLAAMRFDDADVRERRRALSAAKVIVGQACRFVGQQAVQLHGGMGVTDEMPVSHCFKRLLAIELSLGDTDHHLEQFSGTENR